MKYYRYEDSLDRKEAVFLPHSEVCGDFGDFSAYSAVLSLLSQGDMRYGDPAAMARRKEFYAQRRIDPARVYSPPLKHTRNVAVLRGLPDSIAWRQSLEDSGGADGVVADGREEVGRGLAVTVADCMPIWLFDRRFSAYGILHSGWKGTGILSLAVDRMRKEFGCSKDDILAILGPSIGSCCYMVDAERAAVFSAEFGESSIAERPGEGEVYLDLRKANLGIAERIGLGAVLDIDLCTACASSLGSFRRQGSQAFTRMLALAASGLPNFK